MRAGYGSPKWVSSWNSVPGSGSDRRSGRSDDRGQPDPSHRISERSDWRCRRRQAVVCLDWLAGARPAFRSTSPGAARTAKPAFSRRANAECIWICSGRTQANRRADPGFLLDTQSHASDAGSSARQIRARGTVFKPWTFSLGMGWVGCRFGGRCCLGRRTMAW